MPFDPLDAPDDLALLDALADLTAGEVPELARVQARYNADARLRMDGRLTSYTSSGPQTVDVW